MNRRERIWWGELADQYEEWAENPPGEWVSPWSWVYHAGKFQWAQEREFIEDHTCMALEFSRFGWDDNVPWKGLAWNVSEALEEVWLDQYGKTTFPAGGVGFPDRDELRFEFCWYMAERIREELGR